MKRIVFLDVDGVLNIMSKSYNTSDYKKDKTVMYVEPHLAQRLEWILKKTEASIVISSSWRYDMDELKIQMEKAGFRMWDKVIGRTTYNHNHRGLQILDWLENNECDRYVVIDDEIKDICGEDLPYIPEDYVVKTDEKNGMSHQEAVKAIGVLIQASTLGDSNK
jgi:hypothetical protein